MKRIGCVVLIISLLGICHSPALGQVFYIFPDAAIVEQNRMVVGTHLGLGDDNLVRWEGYGRLGVAKYFDAGAEVLVDRVGGEWMGGLGIDVRFGLFPEGTQPFDLSLNGGIGYLSGGGADLLQIPLGGVISSPFKFESGGTMIPYVGAYLLIVDSTVDTGVSEVSDTDVDVEARGGVSYTMNPKLNLYATLHLGRDTIIYLGLNYRL